MCMRNWQNEGSQQTSNSDVTFHAGCPVWRCGRTEGLLESAINTPLQTFGGQELYPTVLEKAARLGYGLIHNHPFLDGNKRIGTHAMLVFLDINNITLSYEDDDLIAAILRVASGDMDDGELLEWLKAHIE